MISEKESLTLIYLKSFAIISVVCAHISIVPDSFSVATKICCGLLTEIGAVGVGVFFIISGYLFKRKAITQYQTGRFIIKKIKNIVIPWLIAASLVYLYVALRKGGTLEEGLLSIVGYKSSYWYLSVLMILYILFLGIIRSKHETIWILISIISTLVSVALRKLSIIESDTLVYLNIFNWTIFFALGYLCAMHREIVSRIISNITITIVSGGCAILVLIIPIMFDIEKFSYFCFWYVPAELIVCLFLTCISYSLSDKKFLVWRYLGERSFPIYLYHELLWAGFIVYIFNRFDSIFFLIIRPIVVIGIVLLELYIGEFIFKTLKLEKIYYKIIGVNFSEKNKGLDRISE